MTLFILIIPKIIEKIGKTNTVRIGLAACAIASVSRLFFPTSVIWLVAMAFISICGIMTLSFMKPMLTIDCITYGKWKTENAVEAAYSTVNSLADKVGLGIGSVVLGAILQIGGYDGTAAIQSSSALTTITLLYTLIPAALMVIAIVFLVFFNVEKKLPAMKADLEARAQK